MNDNHDINVPPPPPEDAPKAARLGALHTSRPKTSRKLNERYSRVIKRVKFALPIIAILLIGMIFTLNNFEGDKIVPIKEEDAQSELKQEIGKNELVNPRFESRDKKGQPFVLTADKAIQENGEQGEMLLQQPSGKIDLASGEAITLSANNGIYQQLKNTLDMSDNVVLTHSNGYKLQTQILNIDMGTSKAWSEMPVRVTGPQGSINAQGINASSNGEIVIFTGPAKMLLKTEDESLGFGEMLP